MENEYNFVIVIKNIKDPNGFVSGGMSNKYRGAYKKIFDILDEDSIFVQAEVEDEILKGNDFYLYFNSFPDTDKLQRISKIPNVEILNKNFAKGGLIAPNGKPSNLTPEQYKLVRTPAFIKWFGDWINDPQNASKVVDENGEPQVCYHGTFSENLNSFDEKKIGHNTGNEGHYGYGFYFSFDRIEASTYTYHTNPIILECFLNIRNPFLSSNLENLERYSNRYGYYEEKKPVAIDSEWLESELKKHKDQKPYLLYKSIKENGYEKGWELFLDKNKIDWDNETFDYNRINDWYEYDSSKEEFSKENEDENYNDEIPEYILENISEQLNVPLSEIKTIKQYTVGNYPSLLYMMDLGNRSRDLTDEIKQDGFDGIIAGSEIVLFKSNQIKLADGTNTTFDSKSDDIRFEQGGEINEEAQQLIDIISMHPNLEKYQKYKVLLKDKFGIDFDLMYKDQEYIDNANLSDIKSQDDFFDFGNWLSYAKIISTKRGFVPMDSYWGRSEEMTDENWNETADKLGFTVEKYNYEERGNNGGDVAYAFANKLFYTKEADLYYFLHEIGHIYDFQNTLTGIIKNPAYSPTNYGTTHSGETFAENFAIYFLNPTALKNWNEDVYYAMDLAINDKYKKELKKIVSEKSKFEKGGRTISQTPAPKKDRIVGSDVNKKSSSKSLSSAKLIKFDAKTLNTIKNKVATHNEENPNKKINLASAKAVVRRGMGAYSSSHRPTISNGLPNSRLAWGLARLNAFTYKIINGKSKSGKYKQDDDLIEELGFKVANYKNGGEMKKDIRCVNCGWEWNKKDSELWDMYVCHKCGFDNTTFYTSIPVNTFGKGGETETKNPNYLEMFLGK